MGDRIAVLKDGLLQQVGTPRDLYEKPNNVFVAGFIGSPAMNLFPVDLASAGGIQFGTAAVEVAVRAELLDEVDRDREALAVGGVDDDVLGTHTGGDLRTPAGRSSSRPCRTTCTRSTSSRASASPRRRSPRPDPTPTRRGWLPIFGAPGVRPAGPRRCCWR
jgi:ABC-type Fe3+/spermidine/putrescine transport system ATPase subunit